MTGDASADGRGDAMLAMLTDAAPEGADSAVSVQLSVTPAADSCGDCFAVSAAGPDPQVAYTFLWDDGSTAANRRICSDEHPPHSVTLRDPNTLACASAIVGPLPFVDLCGVDAGPPVAPLCLSNGSFEAQGAGGGTTLSSDLDAAPWQVCGEPPNFAQLVDSNMVSLFTLPQPTEGQTYLTLSADDQVSQALCAPLGAGTSFSFRFDLAHNDVAQDGMISPVLEVWGGPAATCEPAELLWSSPALATSGWRSFCGTAKLQKPMASITLLAKTSAVLPSPYEVLVDNLRAVASCAP